MKSDIKKKKSTDGTLRTKLSSLRIKKKSSFYTANARVVLIFVRFAAERHVEERIRKVGNERERDVAGTAERFSGRDFGQRPAVAESRGAEQSLETQVAGGEGQNERGVSETFFRLAVGRRAGFFKEFFFCFFCTS